MTEPTDRAPLHDLLAGPAVSGPQVDRILDAALELYGTFGLRRTTVDDVARCAVFLAGFPTNALTGQSVVVSHGWFMQ